MSLCCRIEFLDKRAVVSSEVELWTLFICFFLTTICPLPSQKQPGASTHLRAIFVIILPTKTMQKDISSRCDSEQLRIFTLCLLHLGEQGVVFYRP